MPIFELKKKKGGKGRFKSKTLLSEQIATAKRKKERAKLKEKNPKMPAGLKRGGPVDMPKRTKKGKTIKPKLGLPPKRSK